MRDPSPDLSTQVSALARRQEHTARELAQLGTRVRELATILAAHTDHHNEAEKDEEGTPRMRAWLQTGDDPDTAHAVLDDLTRWLHEVYLRYPGAVLPSCWLWHPAVVEELCWLRAAHRDAYHPRTGTAVKAADWHERHRPGVARRIQAGIGTCELALHDPPREALPVPLAEALDRIAAEWATQRGTPRPTPQDLAEASEHDNLTNQQPSYR